MGEWGVGGRGGVGVGGTAGTAGKKHYAQQLYSLTTRMILH